MRFLALLGYVVSTSAREIVFPSTIGISDQILLNSNGVDVMTGSAFAGLTTYANLPYVHCLAGEVEEVERYDIAILGAPFDTVSCCTHALPRKESVHFGTTAHTCGGAGSKAL
jgi:hypothetical protein